MNPPGKIAGMTPDMSEDIAHRCLVGLAKLALGDSAYLVLTNNGPRAAIDTLRLYPSNERITRASFRVLRGLLQNPATMMKFRKQKRFRILPRVVSDAVDRFPNSLDVQTEASHLLWTYTGIGGFDAQEAVLGVGFLDVIKVGLESARQKDKTESKDSRVRKFVGCLLSLAVKNEFCQNRLVQEGLRSLVRKSLVEFPKISFHGEFAELRDWIRGDRGGAKSVGKASTAREMNVAENQVRPFPITTHRLPDYCSVWSTVGKYYPLLYPFQSPIHMARPTDTFFSIVPALERRSGFRVSNARRGAKAELQTRHAA